MFEFVRIAGSSSAAACGRVLSALASNLRPSDGGGVVRGTLGEGLDGCSIVGGTPGSPSIALGFVSTCPRRLLVIVKRERNV